MFRPPVGRKARLWDVGRFVVQRCWVLYLIAGVILFFFVDSSVARLNRLNHLKQVEHQIKSFEQGLAPLNTEELRWAVRYYRELLRFFPPSDLIYGNLGFCYYYLKDYAKALEAYQKAVSLEPHVYFYYWDMGVISFQVGDMKTALSFFETSLKLMPATVVYYERLTERLPEKNKYMVSLVEYLKNRAVADEERVYYYGGLANFLLGDYQQAVVYFSKAIVLDPNDISAYYYRGLSLEKLGHEQQKRQDFQKVSYLKSRGIEEGRDLTDDFRPHLNTELVVLRYQSDK